MRQSLGVLYLRSGLGYVPLRTAARRRLPQYKTTKLRCNADYARLAPARYLYESLKPNTTPHKFYLNKIKETKRKLKS